MKMVSPRDLRPQQNDGARLCLRSTVDGRNPARKPAGMYETLYVMKYINISAGAGFLPSTV